MHFITTTHSTPAVDFKAALAQGLAPDGGLFVPEKIPTLRPEVLARFSEQTLPEIAFEMLAPYLLEEISEVELRALLADALNFPIPTTPLHDDIHLVELFHGPTLAFKDVAARVMARLTAALLPKSERLTVLVATSGDTGGAVAHAYHNLPNIQVRLLYPKGKVSPLQEKQLTTLGGNVAAFEVDGTFDDCQRLVKEAFRDADLVRTLGLTSANSINIARLLPQMTYYAHAYAPFLKAEVRPLIAVPSGNFGNLTAGTFAQTMGLPIPHFIAANNRNDPVRDYLENGTYQDRPSVHTLSNAMDIGAPSNVARLRWLTQDSLETLREKISAFTTTDEETLEQMRVTYEKSGRILDPHTAVGVHAVKQYREKTGDRPPVLVLSTAHPAKFPEVVERALGLVPEIPASLSALQERQKQAETLTTKFSALKACLLSQSV